MEIAVNLRQCGNVCFQFSDDNLRPTHLKLIIMHFNAEEMLFI